ncbi:2-oxo-hept-4-ene-1,7-dioate hydratase [wastewater metagenome]|uniref:2-oxo-hept-4-ene-1,7-dioate hydratase n=2 Tax=unclassified sequences TaxID=12908 RepID=A0A5B8RB35_9ZZZZ|nr:MULTISPECIES: 2-oxo-hepta-3-ene-1,7-dioic acid hydratase [Arhodomonas]QEA03965.1 2-oxo-hept-4-ene-1,7-dioate hydratase [uncultured organism]
MLSEDAIRDAAERLDHAESDRSQIDHLTLQYPELGFEDAYAIQRRWVDMKAARGRRVMGHKIGLTSRAMQRSAHIDEPDYGVLLDDMFFEDNGGIPVERFIVPRLEVELAFVLCGDLTGPDCTVLDVMRATEYVIPALEIIDARVRQVDPASGAPRKVFDTISDNAANAGVVLGGRTFRPFDVDLRWSAAVCSRNGVVEETGVAAGVLGHPAKGIAWLANKLAPHGVTLRAGEIVLAGSFTRPVAASAGDTFHVDYGPLGAIGLQFV